MFFLKGMGRIGHVSGFPLPGVPPLWAPRHGFDNARPSRRTVTTCSAQPEVSFLLGFP